MPQRQSLDTLSLRLENALTQIALVTPLVPPVEVPAPLLGHDTDPADVVIRPRHQHRSSGTTCRRRVD